MGSSLMEVFEIHGEEIVKWTLIVLFVTFHLCKVFTVLKFTKDLRYSGYELMAAIIEAPCLILVCLFPVMLIVVGFSTALLAFGGALWILRELVIFITTM